MNMKKALIAGLIALSMIAIAMPANAEVWGSHNNVKWRFTGYFVDMDDSGSMTVGDLVIFTKWNDFNKYLFNFNGNGASIDHDNGAMKFYVVLGIEGGTVYISHNPVLVYPHASFWNGHVFEDHHYVYNYGGW